MNDIHLTQVNNINELQWLEGVVFMALLMTVTNISFVYICTMLYSYNKKKDNEESAVVCTFGQMNVHI
jgi:hypothetical protein